MSPTVALNRRRGAKQSEPGIVKRLLSTLVVVALSSFLVSLSIRDSVPTFTYLQEWVQGDTAAVVNDDDGKGGPGRSEKLENINNLTTAYEDDRLECSLTVVILEPRMPYFGKNDTMFTKTLESVAEYVPDDSCIVLQTSICQLRKCLENGIDPQSLVYLKSETDDDDKSAPDYDPQVKSSCNSKQSTRDNPAVVAVVLTDAQVLQRAATMIRERSGPHLVERFWKTGRVRVSIIDHKRYGFPACDQFESPNRAFYSASYWIDEFVPQESDKILMVQRDAFMCKKLDLSRMWNDIDYVGGHWYLDMPWLKINFQNNKTMHFRPERQSEAAYDVHAWRKYWRQIDSVYTGHSTNSPQTCDTLSAMTNNIHCPLPTMPNNLVFPETLPNKKYWVGNGGFSLRSRKWMVRIIRLCPRREFSHLSGALVDDSWCLVKNVNEDMVFSMILTLVGANVASPLQASFFGSDHNFGWPNHFDESTSTIERELGQDALSEYEKEIKEVGHAVPIGQHKCFKKLFPTTSGYGCIDSKWCKYSFNTDGRLTRMD